MTKYMLWLLTCTAVACMPSDELPMTPEDAGAPNDAAKSDAQVADSERYDASQSADSSVFIPPPQTVELNQPEKWRPCEHGPTPVQAVDAAYVVPDHPFSAPLDVDINDLRAVYGDELFFGFEVRFPEKNETGDVFAYDVFKEPGEDLEFLLTVSTRGDAQEFTTSLTVLVDYQPVEAEFEVSDSARRVRRNFIGSGAAFESGDLVDFVKVTVPESAFRTGQNHEMAVAASFSRDSQKRLGFAHRFSVFNGGTQPAINEIPCRPARLATGTTELEREVVQDAIGFTFAGLFPDPIPVPIAGTILRAQPGDTRRIYYTLIRRDFNDGVHTSAIVPVVNGEPAGDVIWREIGGEKVAPTALNVDDRGFFDIKLPDEPGVYDVQLRVWQDPFVRWRPFGSLLPVGGLDGVRQNGPITGSSVLTFDTNP